MKYDGSILTVDNYRSILKGCGFDEDLLDEVRSAIFDSVDLSTYLAPDVDPYYLQQVRVGSKQGVPSWVFSLPGGDLIRRCRILYSRGINLDPVSRYVIKALPAEYYEVLLNWIEAGVVIPEDDISQVRKELLTFLSWAVLRGIDAYDLVVAPWGMNTVYAKNALILREAGFDITAMVQDKWHTDVVEFLPMIMGYANFKTVYPLFNATTDLETAQVLGAMLQSKFPLSTVPNIEQYSGFQLDIILEAFENGVDYSGMLDPELGYRDLKDLYIAGLSKKSRRMSLRL